MGGAAVRPHLSLQVPEGVAAGQAALPKLQTGERMHARGTPQSAARPACMHYAEGNK